MSMDYQNLNTAKAHRTEAKALLDEVQIRLAADGVDLDLGNAHVAAVLERRSGAVAACRSDVVVACDELLRVTRVDAEIAASEVTRAITAHVAAVSEYHAADAAVRVAADRIRRAEQSELAELVMCAFDHAEALGRSLQHFTGSLAELPPKVSAALLRIPKGDDLNRPLFELRGGYFSQLKWDARLRELCADEAVKNEEAEAA